MTERAAPIIQLEHISKQFPGVLALDDVSLEVFPGEIHALIGENGAGKSTLMNILAGELQPDEGEIIFMGGPCQIPNAYISQQMGISVVYQEMALCPNLTVSENILLNTVSGRLGIGFVDRRDFARKARKTLDMLGMQDTRLQQPLGQLSVAQQQMVEIAKALSGNVKLLILDEPNSALTHEESLHLFKVLRQLRAEGVAIIYVSHRLEEVLDLADRITVLRDGKYIDTVDGPTATVDDLISMMVGRVIVDLYQRDDDKTVRDELVLEVKGLGSGNALDHVTFDVHAGEIVGIAGLPDAGKDELVECCFGLRAYTGEIHIRGEAAAINSPQGAMQKGLAFVPADRRGAGALLVMDVQNNVSAASLKRLSNGGFLNRPAMRRVSDDYVERLDIRISGLAQQMATLSGGNQQKVILARGLATSPSLLILHEPTRGIDVGAKAEIYGIIQRLAAEGVATIIVSSELPELIGQCDRILVMHEGRIAGHFTHEEAEEEPILACAMGQAEHL